MSHCAAGEITLSPARLSELANHTAWRALLHANSANHSRIHDPHFFLATPPFNAKNELIATLRGFQQPASLADKHPICRFPARFQWLSRQLQLSRASFPQPDCQQYHHFLNKVPANQIELVFASKNVVSPSSMMGHVFLKLAGKRSDGRHAEHAVTYFTLLDSFNVPKIVYQNFAGGMQGYFALQPYRRLKENYLQREYRNIWEYQLTLQAWQRDMIRAHIWELKDIDSDYMFAAYNCATLTWYFMQIVAPEAFAHYPKLWVSPIDVIKTASRHQLIRSTRVVTSNRWKIQMLLDQSGIASSTLKSQLAAITPEQATAAIQALPPANRLLAHAYLDYLQQSNPAALEQFPAADAIQSALNRQSADYQIDYSHYKQPTRVPGNMQLRMETGRSSLRGNFAGLAWLPAANRLTDDQRQFFSANELRLGELSARLYQGGHLQLERATLYAVKSLSPWNGLTHNISGQWQTGFTRQFDGQLHDHLVYQLSGGIGYSAKLTPDLLIYGLYNIGGAFNTATAYLYHYPEAGLFIDEVFNMKTSVTYEARFNNYGDKQRQDNIRACQSYYPDTNITLLACYRHARNHHASYSEGNLRFQIHF